MNARKIAQALRLLAEAFEEGNDPGIPDSSSPPPKRKTRRVHTFPPPPAGMVVPTEMERMRARRALARDS